MTGQENLFLKIVISSNFTYRKLPMHAYQLQNKIGDYMRKKIPGNVIFICSPNLIKVSSRYNRTTNLQK